MITTPQDVSLNIAQRGLRMFEKVSVPILGLIENMSDFVCPHCGTHTAVFKSGGGERLSDRVHAPLLGKIPLDAAIVVGGDAGRPLLVDQPDSAAAAAYRNIAQRLREAVAVQSQAGLPDFTWNWESGEGAPAWDTGSHDKAAPAVPAGMKRRDARTLSVLWRDGREDTYDARDLRLVCPCAMCVDEMSGRRTLDPHTIAMDVAPRTLKNVGRYAVSVTWTDGHSTGIYSFERLRRLGDAAHAHGSFEV